MPVDENKVSTARYNKGFTVGLGSCGFMPLDQKPFHPSLQFYSPNSANHGSAFIVRNVAFKVCMAY